MIGFGFFIFFFVVIRFLDCILERVQDDYTFTWSFQLIISAIPAIAIEFSFRHLLKTWPFN